MSARYEAMRVRNDDRVRELAVWFNAGHHGPAFFRTEILQNGSEPSLGWDLSADDRAEFDVQLSVPKNRAAIDRIAQFIR